MSDSITEYSDNLLNWQRKKTVDVQFIPWMIGSNVLTMLDPLFRCQIVQIFSLLGGKLEREENWIGGRSVLIHIRSIRSGRYSSSDG